MPIVEKDFSGMIIFLFWNISSNFPVFVLEYLLLYSSVYFLKYLSLFSKQPLILFIFLLWSISDFSFPQFFRSSRLSSSRIRDAEVKALWPVDRGTFLNTKLSYTHKRCNVYLKLVEFKSVIGVIKNMC